MTDLSISTAVFTEKIGSVVNESEQMFLTLGKVSPLFVRELHENLVSLEQSFASETGVNTAISKLDRLFTQTKDRIGNCSLIFSKMHDRGSSLLTSLSDSLDRLKAMEGIIEKIRNDSEDMALISLNALTGALKSGAAGRGFSVITEELMRLSDQTKVVTDQLESDSLALMKQLTGFTGELKKLEELQNTVFEGLDELITQQFVAIEEKVKNLTKSLYALVQESKTLEKPVCAIMETIQIHDIVRQSLDHILIALREYEDIKNSASVDADELEAFKGQLLILGEVIMEDVISRFEEALRTFDTAFTAIQKLIRRGEKERTILLREHFSHLSSSSMQTVFEESARTLTMIEQNLSSYLAIKQSVASQGSRIAEYVLAISKQYGKFEKIINRFNTIDIAARIEISKQSMLHSIKNTVTAMTGLINRISSDVEDAKKSSQSFIEDTHTALFDYGKTFGEEVTTFSLAQQELVQAFRLFASFQEDLEQNTRNFTLFSETFINLLETQEHEIGKIKNLIIQCKQIKDYFSEIRAKMPESSENVEIRNQHLKDIISKFTIYAHKQAAAEIGNFEVSSTKGIKDVDLEAGEITFF
ncbi:hypothetical protein [Gracilinema caldarium]|uniref:hypothetical protein n=1 Tax=Gracilinema caldarium TaxID=215591 RepID=UPI0026EA54DD|nr:hypothetical protein [Gracilinema caldarium]